jgi:hypothetical protein
MHSLLKMVLRTGGNGRDAKNYRYTTRRDRGSCDLPQRLTPPRAVPASYRGRYCRCQSRRWLLTAGVKPRAAAFLDPAANLPQNEMDCSVGV